MQEHHYSLFLFSGMWMSFSFSPTVSFITSAQGAEMTFTKATRSIALGIAIALSGAVAAQATSSAKDAAGNMPKNASPKSYGIGWECDRGYRADEGRCMPVKIPMNAYATKSSFGRVWNCKRGYARKNDTCAEIEVPEHGYLNSDGDGWRCRRGFVKVENDCAPIQVPANAFLSSDTYGRGWECERGYVVRGLECVSIDVPENAHLNFFGTGWECDPSYRYGEGKCVEQ